jgi:C1A family cysteine protease
MTVLIPRPLGWHRDLPDHRDYGSQHAEVVKLLDLLPGSKNGIGALPESVDWREYCTPVRDQQALLSCTALACIGLVEYFEQRATGKAYHLSPLFLYKTTRRLLHLQGDTGATIRYTWKALVQFGIPPEEYLPYDVAKYDAEPDPFLYSCAKRFPAILYVRLDPPCTRGEGIVLNVKAYLAAGFPCAFGFPVTDVLSADGNILFPRKTDTFRGGQAVLAVGFDDHRRIGSASKGALLIRNSWGLQWGEEGYGWLPYEYLLKHLAVDFWTLLNRDWLDCGEFTRPAL